MKTEATYRSEAISEQTLLQRVQHGDAAAAEVVYRRHVRYLSAICSRYIRDDEDIRDILQESFLKIFAAVGSFRYEGEGSLRGWMARITLNETLRFLRKNSQLAFVERDVEQFDCIDEEPETTDVPTSVIHQFIRELPDGYRAVFNLYVIEEKSHKEIAALLGIKEASSASQLHHAKAMLAKRINEYTRLKSSL